MHTQLTQSTTQPTSTWLKTGLCSLALGVSSVLFATSAFAVPLQISASDELFAGPAVLHPTISNFATDGDFYINAYNLGNPLNGVDDWYFGEFDLSSTDWTNFTVIEAKLTFTLTPKNSWIKTDEILLGSVFDINTYTLTDEVLLPDLFVGGNSPNNYGLPLPTLGTEITIVDLDLLAFFSGNKFTKLLNGGDPGKIWWKFSDDAQISYAKLEITAVQNPEPASLILLGTGLVGLAAWRCRKDKKA